MIRLREIVATTLELLGEVNPLSESTFTNNALPLESLIVSFAGQAIEDVQLGAPVESLSFDEIPGDPVARQDGSGYFVLPPDYVGRFAIRMHGWRRDVTDVAGASSATAMLQRHPSTRGGCSRPVCVLDTAPDGSAILNYYSLPARLRIHRADKKLYVRRVVVDRDDRDMELPLERRLLFPVCFAIARYVGKALSVN